MSNLSYIYFGLFDNCNARCNMCDCWASEKANLRKMDYTRTLNAVIQNGCNEVRFTGGEPLLYPGLTALIRQCHERGVRTSVISNGWLLPRLLPRLADAGLGSVIVSLDGTESIHDNIRGLRGLFRRAVEGLNAAGDIDLGVVVNTVLQRESLTAESLDGLLGALIRLRKPPSLWQLIPVRDSPHLVPVAEQWTMLSALLPNLRETCEAHGIKLVASDERNFGNGSPPCSVPKMARYVDGRTGTHYACNMLLHAQCVTGTIVDGRWFESARTLVDQIGAGDFELCQRCDPASRQMNFELHAASQGSV